MPFIWPNTLPCFLQSVNFGNFPTSAPHFKIQSGIWKLNEVT